MDEPAVLNAVPSSLSDSISLPLPLNEVSKVPLALSRVTAAASTLLLLDALNSSVDVLAITIWVPSSATAFPTSELLLPPRL